MPPFRSYLFLYVIFAIVLAGAIVIAREFFAVSPLPNPSEEQTRQLLLRNILILFGVAIAFLSLLSSSISQWQTMRSQHAFSALQNLRTDREYIGYLIAMDNELRKRATKDPNHPYQFSKQDIKDFLEPRAKSSLQEPSFDDAAIFVLNQHEFIAAAVRQRTMDYRLVRATAKGAICSLAKSFQPVIKELRDQKQATGFENLIWLYRKLSHDNVTDFGGDPITGWSKFLRQIGRVLGVVKHGG